MQALGIWEQKPPRAIPAAGVKVLSSAAPGRLTIAAVRNKIVAGRVWRGVTDWLDILREQAETGAEMAREVPATLANPDISRDQVKKLFAALEQQAEFVEKLRQVLEANDFEPEVLVAAEALEDRYAELAASAAERLKAMRSGEPVRRQ
jgi:hypothetical protein